MRTLAAIPVYNEAESIVEVVEDTRNFVDDVLVVDDGSTDGTTEILDGLSVPGLVVLHHNPNRGYGRSLMDAFAYAIGEDFDCVVTLDADGQHEPEAIPRLVSDIGVADIVSGSRYLMTFADTSTPPYERRCINKQITALLRWRLGFDITDAFCGFKAYRVEALKRLRLTEEGYAMPLQLWVQAAALGLKVIEVPVKLIYRDVNRSFGANLDRPAARMRYYLDVIERECRAVTSPTDGLSCAGCGRTGTDDV
ncbi:MAG TPA: glycosyltransferase family 2 protein [Planctomycetota bacterium]|nr:glycosyltransferase family 2 protein [Planctomycetota bacterium]